VFLYLTASGKILHFYKKGPSDGTSHLHLHCDQIYIQLGFDADMLELLMRELDDVVDRFFIIESTRTHNKVRVPLDLHVA
jgi:hypothetical protein